jgi:hypothetical protein
MKRFACAAFLCSLALAPAAFAQAGKTAPAKATPATQTTTATPPVMKARMATPLKGTAFIEVIQGVGKHVGTDMVTVSRIKNVSSAPIAGLRVDEFWYDKKLAQVSGDTERVKQPIAPGEVIDVTTKSPFKPDLYRPQLTFTHANGTVTVKAVKKFTDAGK